MSYEISTSEYLYRKMYMIRKAEDVIIEHYAENEMKTPMHMSRGEEAISVGIISALDKEDQITCTYRSHAAYLSKTGDLNTFFKEIFGKQGGTANGKGGSMHLVDPDKGLICSTAIVGTNIPIGVGAAFANKMKNNSNIVAIFFGDGAVDEGVFWESLNIACLMNLPVLFVYENNSYAVHSFERERHAYRNICSIVKEYGCEIYKSQYYNTNHEIDHDVEIFYFMAKNAREYINYESKPLFISCNYYRHLEHVGVYKDFDAEYRLLNEENLAMQYDPLLIQQKRIDKSILENIHKEVDAQVMEAFEKAKLASFPDNSELYNGVYY